DFRRPPLKEFIAIDPSEAVRSEEILPLLKEYFRIEYLKNFNGTILHQLYPLLNPELTNNCLPDFDSILRLILFFEEVLIKERVLSSDFAFAICRRRDFRAGVLPRAKTPAGGRFIGFIDIFDDDTICGWAADRLDPLKSLDLDIYLDNELKTTVHSDIYRADLIDAGYADARKGFHFRFPTPVGGAKAVVAQVRVHQIGEVVTTRTRGAFDRDVAV